MQAKMDINMKMDMKKMRTLLLLLLTTVAGWAQGEGAAESRWSVTPHIGVNRWTARYTPMTDDAMGHELGLTVGAELGFRVVPRVSLSLGADYTLQRFSQPVSESTNSLLRYTGDMNFTIATGRACFPLLAGVNVWKGLALRTGIELGVTLHTNTAKVDVGSLTMAQTTFEKKYYFDPVHWYLPVSLSYEYKRWVADLRYYYSLKKNHWKVDTYGVTSVIMQETHNKEHDSMLQLTIGYRFSL